ncbi:MAG: dephospho-CoA kinase [Bacteroidetes bacterium RIFCSPLOWO2_12_FULL_31_6]|nr:MAG: dephospho-CoA kinase [Bacteroidetes bacterium RIFCSPLOWO2_12_FULL_31_6]
MSLKEKRNNKPLLVGLTGGIGSGKSTVAKIFNALGVKIYNSDVEAKNIVNTDVEVIKLIKQKFGKEIYENGLLNSKKLAQLVFDNKAALEELNAIVHPKVKQHFEHWIQHHTTEKILTKEAAILIESGAYKTLDKIILVTAPEELKIKRVLARDDSNETDIRKKIAAQLSDIEKTKYTDYTIVNNEKDLVIPQVLNIYNELNKI